MGGEDAAHAVVRNYTRGRQHESKDSKRVAWHGKTEPNGFQAKRTTGPGVAPFLGLTSLTRGSHPYPGEKEGTVAKERNVKGVHASSDELAGQRIRVESRAQNARA